MKKYLRWVYYSFLIKVVFFWEQIRAASIVNFLMSIIGKGHDPTATILYYVNQKHQTNGELHLFFGGGIGATETLYRLITDESERYLPLPAKYVAEVEKRIIIPRRKVFGGHLDFIVSEKGISIEEIRANIERWNCWCEEAWAAYD